ncbi:MAG TPA: hypothetical protein VIA62_07130 [Thermoanaerobaculia bacterium]|nr:hypothetical protein [Thermoanaerobaculia bacterium]
MNRILPEFSSTARRALAALARLMPSWTLSGRAALWWLPGVPRPIAQLDLVWHGTESLGSRPQEVVRTLAAAGLDAATLHGDSRQTWVATARDDGSACLLKLTAEPALPLESPCRSQPLGVEVMMATPREVLATALCSLHAKPGLQDLEDVSLLLRSGISLDRGFLDARQQHPGISPQDLALRLARFEVEDPERSAVALIRLRRLQERLVFEILRCSVPDSRAS